MTVRQVGQWNLERPIREGGQGITYIARRTSDEAPYVLKQLKRPGAKARARFQTEVAKLQYLAGAGCPGIVQVIDADVDSDKPWYVMPFYHVMYDPKRNPIYFEYYKGNVNRVLEIAEALADALAFIHEAAGGGHRDVKSSNVFFPRPGSPPLLGDFGLAFGIDEDAALTESQEAIGPKSWRPPELRKGGLWQRHPASDIYMLGGIIYEALTAGETIDETEQLDGKFTHELPQFSLARYITDDSRLVHLTQLLGGMFRRHPDYRISAAAAATLCRTIREWKPGDSPPINTSVLQEAEIAALEFRTYSLTIMREQTKQELKQICDRVSAKFGLTEWAPMNHLTRMVTTNAGDSQPLDYLRQAFPAATWMAVRVLVAFETPRERPMYMSYIFVGRLGTEDIVGLYDQDGNWRELARGAQGHPSHEGLMVDTVTDELERLVRKITPVIRGIRN